MSWVNAAPSWTTAGTFATPMASPGEWALIRPDSYIGAIVGPDNVAELEHYLAKVGLTALAEREV
jgi:hypothetical protein